MQQLSNNLKGEGTTDRKGCANSYFKILLYFPLFARKMQKFGFMKKIPLVTKIVSSGLFVKIEFTYFQTNRRPLFILNIF